MSEILALLGQKTLARFSRKVVCASTLVGLLNVN
jgi:hypothetical protein